MWDLSKYTEINNNWFDLYLLLDVENCMDFASAPRMRIHAPESNHLRRYLVNHWCWTLVNGLESVMGKKTFGWVNWENLSGILEKTKQLWTWSWNLIQIGYIRDSIVLCCSCSFFWFVLRKQLYKWSYRLFQSSIQQQNLCQNTTTITGEVEPLLFFFCFFLSVLKSTWSLSILHGNQNFLAIVVKDMNLQKLTFSIPLSFSLNEFSIMKKKLIC